MWGATRPIKPISPTKHMAAAVNRLTRISTTRRMRSTRMPRLRACSSPLRSRVMAQALRRENGRHTASTRATIATLSRLALARLPMVQNTICWTDSASAMNWISPTTALIPNNRAIPNSTTACTEAPRLRDSTRISNEAAAANTKADSGNSTWAANPNTEILKAITSDAPRVAAAPTPRVNGLARGLFSTVCISAPARPRQAPTTTAINA